jgi:putative addiction module component (TIGR02574 family)
MKTLSQLEESVLQLPDADRARLAFHLLDSLPGVLSDDDEGVAEALRRDAELDRDPAAGITLEELHRAIKQ